MPVFFFYFRFSSQKKDIGWEKNHQKNQKKSQKGQKRAGKEGERGVLLWSFFSPSSFSPFSISSLNESHTHSLSLPPLKGGGIMKNPEFFFGCQHVRFLCQILFLRKEKGEGGVTSYLSFLDGKGKTTEDEDKKTKKKQKIQTKGGKQVREK
jgi:hypothetical protein